MNHKEKYRDRIKTVVCIILTIFIASTIMLAFLPGIIKPKYHYQMSCLNDGWTIEYPVGEKTVTKKCSLSDADIPIMNYQDMISLSRKLPNTSVFSPCIRIHAIHSSVLLYVDGRLIYSYGAAEYARGEMIPMTYLTIPIPERYAGKELKIVMTSGQDSAFGGLDNIYLGSRSDMTILYVYSIRLELFIGNFMCILAMLLFLASPYMLATRSSDTRIFTGAMISLDFGVYILASSCVYSMVGCSDKFNTWVEYSSLYLVPLVVSIYLVSITKDLKMKTFYQILTLVNLSFFLYVLFKHFANIELFSRHTMTLHFICIVQSPIIIGCIIWTLVRRNNRKNDTDFWSTALLFIGLMIFMIFAISEIIIFNILKYISPSGEMTDSHFLVACGSLFLVVCIFISYFIYQFCLQEQENRKNMLMGLAYCDHLTHLANRAKCKEVMMQVKNQKLSYVIISIDLDHLKSINDNCGHMEGDLFLRSFAAALTSSFRSIDLVGRMGGDEFMVLMTSTDSIAAQMHIDSLLKRVAGMVHDSSGLTYSFSYGIASSEELPDADAEEVYQLADRRMYEMKKVNHLKLDKLQVWEV